MAPLAEAPALLAPVFLEVAVERLDVALVLAEVVREIGVASPDARSTCVALSEPEGPRVKPGASWRP